MIPNTIRILPTYWISIYLPICWCCILASAFFFGPFSGECNGAALDFIYINSSVDEAAGGHAAVRLGKNVYHFQYHDRGEFLLEKEIWSEFRFQYNDLQNRTLHVASIPLADTVFQKMRLHFDTRYVLQKKRFLQLEQLKREEDYFRGLVSGKGRLVIPALGLFSPSVRNSHGVSLKQQLEMQLGDKKLDELLQQTGLKVQQAVAQLRPVYREFENLNLYKDSSGLPDGVLQYFELRSLHEALLVLQQERAVAEEAFFILPTLEPLTSWEVLILNQYQQKLVRSIIHLLQSDKRDVSQPLLVQAARYQALARSISSKQLTVIEPFSENCDLLPVDELRIATVFVQNEQDEVEELSFFEQFGVERVKKLRAARQVFFKEQDDQDIAYGLMEKAFGELWEIGNISEKQQYIRVEGGNALPDKSRVLDEISGLEGRMAVQMLAAAEKNRKDFDQLLLATYSYNLFSQNCVTELFQAVYDCFESEQEAAAALGGYIAPGEGLLYIPFKSFELVQQEFPVSSVETYPSYRIRTAERLYEQEGVLSALEESNTITSTIYSPWDEDSTFLFFTDDVVLIRPFFGLGNLVYGVLGSVGGLFTLPVDEGTLIQRSFKGMIFSLPELAFINIRKGSFPTIVERGQYAE